MAETVTLLGSGGREHAMAIGLMEGGVDTLYALPGNGGTAGMAGVYNYNLNPGNPKVIAQFAEDTNTGLVVIGPEQPLVNGVADELARRNIAVLGASAEAARLESSKGFAADFMYQENIPHPPAYTVNSMGSARIIVGVRRPQDLVIKYDGLAGGKGVVLPDTEEEMYETIQNMLDGTAFPGVPAGEVVIQDRWHGPEVSAFVLSDGENFSLIPIAAQDHKRLYEGDQGPNTGGMGAFAPVNAPLLTARQWGKLEEIAAQTIEGMRRRGTPYKGILYIGAMLAEELDGDPAVIEFSARFGDPEAQVLLPLLQKQGHNIYDAFRETANGNVPDFGRDVHIGHAAMTVCLTAPGYPESPVTGQQIHGLDKTYKDVTVIHGGTQRTPDGLFVVTGGRSVYVTGTGETIQDARDNTYRAVGAQGVHFDGAGWRSDIAHQALAAA